MQEHLYFSDHPVAEIGSEVGRVLFRSSPHPSHSEVAQWANDGGQVGSGDEVSGSDKRDIPAVASDPRNVIDVVVLGDEGPVATE